MKTGKAIAFLLSVIFAIPASAQHKWHIGIGEEMTIAVEKERRRRGKTTSRWPPTRRPGSAMW